MALFLGDGGERTLSPFNRGGGCGLLLLERVQLVDGLSLNGRCAVIVADLVRLLVRLDLRQAVPSRPGPFLDSDPGPGCPEAKLSVLHVSVPCHISSLHTNSFHYQKQKENMISAQYLRYGSYMSN